MGEGEACEEGGCEEEELHGGCLFVDVTRDLKCVCRDGLSVRTIDRFAELRMR